MGRRRGEMEPRDYAGMMRRMLRAYGRSVHDPADLSALVALRTQVDEATAVAVANMRALGFSDAEIGEGLGIKRQSVRERWPRENPTTLESA